MTSASSGMKRVSRELREYVLLILAGPALTLTGISCYQCRDNTRLLIVMSIFTSLTWIFLWKGNSGLADFLDNRISWIRFPLRRLGAGLVLAIVYTTAVMVILEETFESVFSLNLTTSTRFSIGITLVISLFMHGRAFLLNWRQAAIDAERLQAELIQSRYESLKQQVNPHFLFNSLSTLMNLVYENPQKAVRFIDELSVGYGYITEQQDQVVVPLSKELAFLDSYFFLQRIRFGENVTLSVNLPSYNSVVPPLALQMAVENAIKHNVISAEAPLKIEVTEDDGFIVVRNNLQLKRSLGEHSSGVGLENIRKRYESLTQKKVYAGQVEDCFMIRLPVLLPEMILTPIAR